MNIVIAVALLALLLVHIGEQSHRPAQRKTRAGNEEELDWIDEGSFSTRLWTSTENRFPCE